MNLKERLSSTDNLLRAIRGGGKDEQRPSTSTPPSPVAGSAPQGAQSLLRTPVSVLLKKAWGRPLSLAPRAKALACGVSLSLGHVTISLVRRSDASVQATGRYAYGPEQHPGQPGAADFLRSCLERTLGPGQSAEYWAVLRSSDVDLNVLSVPKLSGDKLDAAVFWSLQKEKKFAEAEYALDYLVLGPAKDTAESRLDVLTCLARKADVDALASLFREAGVALTGITVVPAALLNLYRRPEVLGSHGVVANLHVESDYSAIGLYSPGRLLFSRFIRSGAGSMTDDLVEHFRSLSRPVPAEIHDIDLELPLPGAEPEQGGYASDAALPGASLDSFPGSSLGAASVPQPLDPPAAQALLQHALLGGPEPEGLAPDQRLSPSEVMRIISPAIERMARQVERTLEYFSSTQSQPCEALHFSGEIFGSSDVLNALALQLGYPPAAFDAPAILRTPEGKVPPGRRMTLAPSIAAALSSPDRGINLVRNYKRRTAHDLKQRVNRLILLGVAVAMLFLGAAGFWFEQGAKAKRAELVQAQALLAALGPTIGDDQLAAALQNFTSRKEALRRASGRLAGPAALAELARRTPERVKLMSLSVDTLAATVPSPNASAAPAPSAANATAKPGKSGGAPPPAAAQQAAGLVVLEGVVLGNKADFDAILAQFMMELQSSPLFASPELRHSSLRELPDEGPVLFFVIHAGVR